MSDFTIGLHLCGKNQYATMPGSAVVPCIEYNGMASAGVSGNCLRCTLVYLLLFFGIVIIFESACQRLQCKDARPYSTGAIQARSVVTCRAVNGARCGRQKVVITIIDLDVNRLGHECTDALALAMLRIYCCLCITVLIIGFVPTTVHSTS